ncbi:MAG: isoprenoid biosynthesis glyoxalase ElbB [Rickettsiales bacterium]
MTRAAVILSGCGHLDGTEIREATIALLELDKRGIDVRCFAPDAPQAHVVNHATGEERKGESRNCLDESARVARGAVSPLRDADMDDFDMLVLPGGFGAAKNVSSLAFDGKNASVIPDYARCVLACLERGVPIAAICISPAVLTAAVKGKYSPRVTIGDDEQGLIAGLGGIHVACATHDAVFDDALKIASCSAYMRGDARLKDVAEGVAKAIEQACIWATEKK